MPYTPKHSTTKTTYTARHSATPVHPALPPALAVTLAGATLASTVLPAHAITAPIAGPTGGPGTYSEQNIAATLKDDAASYRIPALANLGNGTLLTAWDSRPYSAADAPNPNSIVMRRSTDNGATWSDISYIARGNLGTDGTQKYGYSDPSFVVDHQTGKVFAFFVYSQNQGFFGSSYGSSTRDPNVIGAVVVESADGGLTWSAPRDITPVAKPSNVKATFATSGEGIQLRYGPHAGRLIQQYVGKVRTASGAEEIQAYSLYSDDHGVTWKRGGYVGTSMDENKVVELSDGRLMLNSRDSANGGYRKVAISNDGGITWGPLTQDTELPDPTNNASITRMYPDAPQGSAEAKKLIFTHSNNNANGNRINLAARVSCDDGATWPGVRTFKQGFGAYSTATAIGNGTYGVLYEASYTSDIRFGTFDETWLNVACAPLHAEPTALTAGATTTVPVTITNQEPTALTGTVSINDAAGLSAPAVPVSNLAPGASTVVHIPITARSNATGGKVDAVFTADNGKQSRFTFTTTVSGSQQALGLNIHSASAPARDLTTNPYRVGETITYTFTVDNISGETVSVVPTAGNFDTGFLPVTAPNCRYRALPADASYTCTTASHTITQADLDAGSFTPQMTFAVTSAADATRTTSVTHTGEPIRLRAATHSASANITMAPSATAASYKVGDSLAFTFTVSNPTEGAINVVPTAGTLDATGFLPVSAPNCRYIGLAAGASYTCTTARYTVTQADLDRGYLDPSATFAVTSRSNGQSANVTATAPRINLPRVVQVAPSQPAPTAQPTSQPSAQPTAQPTATTPAPSQPAPTVQPTTRPTVQPSTQPTAQPTASSRPTASPAPAPAPAPRPSFWDWIRSLFG